MCVLLLDARAVIMPVDFRTIHACRFLISIVLFSISYPVLLLSLSLVLLFVELFLCLFVCLFVCWFVFCLLFVELLI